MTAPGPLPSVAIGVHVHAEPERLRETLAAIEAHTAADFELLLLPDGPDAATAAALAELGHIRQSATEAPRGAPACLNRLWRETDADVVVLLESGTLVGPGWLERLLAALDADPRHGLASPSTNRAWNQLGAFPGRGGDAAAIARTAAEAQAALRRRLEERWRRSGTSATSAWRCAARCSRRSARPTRPTTRGPAGRWTTRCAPCAQAGPRSGRRAPTSGAIRSRRGASTRKRDWFEASRRRYQDKLCGLRSPARAPPTRSTAAASSARTSRRCRRRPRRRGDLAAPLVSCIMPTSGRADWVRQAIRYFLAPGLSEPRADHRRRQRGGRSWRRCRTIRASAASASPTAARSARCATAPASRRAARSSSTGTTTTGTPPSASRRRCARSWRAAPTSPGSPTRGSSSCTPGASGGSRRTCTGGCSCRTCTAARWPSGARCGGSAAATRSCRWPRTPGSCTRRWPPARG